LVFSSYIKKCRLNLGFTQIELVSELFKFDQIFNGLDSNAIGRWERAFAKPPLFKQVKILEYFFEKFDYYFPFLDMENVKIIEQQFSTEGIEKLLGTHKQTVMNFPTMRSDKDNFSIKLSNDSSHLDTAIATAINICDDLYGAGRYYDEKTLKEFSLSPRTLFIICDYKEQYFGHSFFVCLKTDTYNKILNFQMNYQDICMSDLAVDDENGSYMSIGLFAMNKKALSLLFIRFYAYLIMNQKQISYIGTLISIDDAIEIATSFGLKKGATDKDLTVYNGSIKDVLLTEQIIKILFAPSSVPEG